MPVTSSSALAAAMASHIQQTESRPPPRPETTNASFAARLEEPSAPPAEATASNRRARESQPRTPGRRVAPNANPARPPPGSLIDIRV